MNANERNGID